MDAIQSISSAVVVAFLMSTSAFAQLGGVAPLPQIKKSSGPSLEDTTQWITQKLDALTGLIPYDDTLYTPPRKYERRTRWAFDGCNVSIIQSQELRLPPGATKPDFSNAKYELESFKLQELDSDKIRTSPKDGGSANLYLTATGERNTILHEDISEQGSHPYGVQYRSEVDAVILNKQLEILKASKDSFDRPNRWPLADAPGWQFVRFDRAYRIISLPDMDVAERMGNAFRRAITLCQERTAAEKAARPVKPKELF